jgi:PKD repeat protein
METMRGDTVIFTGNAIDDGEVVLYEWDFNGDGIFDFESTTSAAATWVYPDIGEHQAVLRATDDQGATGTATVTVVVHNHPPTLRANNIVSDVEDVELQVSAEDPDGEVVSFVWDPGDGSANITTTGHAVVHSYPDIGEYRVNVTVVDNDGATATTSFWVERVPRAVLHQVFASASVHEVYIGASITFDVDVTGDPGSTYFITWDLGDGNISTEWTVLHTYAEPGTYTVEVTALNDQSVAVSDQLVVKVLWTPNEPPVAVPSVEQWVLPGRNLRFSDVSYDPDGTIVLWQWDFDGDGAFDHSNTTDGNHTHVYPEEGLYTAVLKVTDNRGDVDVATVNIRVDRDAPDDDPVDNSQGAAICCGVMVVILVVIAYWTLRRSKAYPRTDGGPVAVPEGNGGEETGEEPEEDPGEDPGEDRREEPEEDRGEEPEEDRGEEPEEEPGEDRGEDRGEEPEEDREGKGPAPSDDLR